MVHQPLFVGKLVEIKPQDNPITGIQFVGTELEPNCPIPATGHTSKLRLLLILTPCLLIGLLITQVL